MKVLSIILGILLTIAGVICLFRPGETFIAAGYAFAILLFIYGIVGIIGVISRRIRPAYLWAAIPALIIGVVALFIPGDQMEAHQIMLFLLAFFFIVQGIVSIFMAVRTRLFNSVWVLELILGIISIFLGIYSALHPLVGVLAIGILLGIYFIEAGISLIVLGATIGRVEDVVDGAARVAGGAREAFHEAYQEAEKAAAEAQAAQAAQASQANAAAQENAPAAEAPSEGAAPAQPAEGDSANTDNNNA